MEDRSQTYWSRATAEKLKCKYCTYERVTDVVCGNRELDFKKYQTGVSKIKCWQENHCIVVQGFDDRKGELAGSVKHGSKTL